MKIAYVFALALLSGCAGEASDTPASDEYSSADQSSASLLESSSSSEYSYDYSSEEFDEDTAREEAESELASEGYDMRYGCTDDCSGHSAGWDWAAQQGYGSGGSGESQSFQEGTMAYDEAVDERVEEMRDEWESEQ